MTDIISEYNNGRFYYYNMLDTIIETLVLMKIVIASPILENALITLKV